MRKVSVLLVFICMTFVSCASVQTAIQDLPFVSYDTYRYTTPNGVIVESEHKLTKAVLIRIDEDIESKVSVKKLVSGVRGMAVGFLFGDSYGKMVRDEYGTRPGEYPYKIVGYDEKRIEELEKQEEEQKKKK